MPSSTNAKFAADITANWAKYMTEAAKGGDFEPFKSLFAEHVYVVLQNSEGDEVEFSIGHDAELSTMTWEDFAASAFNGLEEQQYDKTISECLGVLGNRMILETGRLNTSGELYLTATSLVEFNGEGKVIGFESFNPMDDAANALTEVVEAAIEGGDATGDVE
jgi:hypothetical protein